MPPIILYNPVLAYETGDDFMRALARRRRTAGSTRSSSCSRARSRTRRSTATGTGRAWASTPTTGQPILTTTWIDRLAPRAAAVLALGTCAAYGGIPAMRNNPTGAMGLRDYLGWGWTLAARDPDRQPARLPGRSPTTSPRRCCTCVLALAGARARRSSSTSRAGPVAIFGRTVHEGCNRAGMAEQGQFADGHGDGRCLVKLGCKGPVVKCNVPIRGWVSGVGGCPNVGGICMACTMPGFPDKYMPFMEADAAARLYARTARFAHGPVVRYLRDRRIRRTLRRRAGAGGAAGRS